MTRIAQGNEKAEKKFKVKDEKDINEVARCNPAPTVSHHFEDDSHHSFEPYIKRRIEILDFFFFWFINLAVVEVETTE